MTISRGPLAGTARGVISSEMKLGVEFESECPDAPSHLDRTGQTEWRRVALAMHTAGLLTQIDRTALASYCALYSRWAQCEKIIKKQGLTYTTLEGRIFQRPEVTLATKCIEQMRHLCQLLGMTPSARGRMVIKRVPVADVLDQVEHEKPTQRSLAEMKKAQRKIK